MRKGVGMGEWEREEEGDGEKERGREIFKNVLVIELFSMINVNIPQKNFNSFINNFTSKY